MAPAVLTFRHAPGPGKVIVQISGINRSKGLQENDKPGRTGQVNLLKRVKMEREQPNENINLDESETGVMERDSGSGIGRSEESGEINWEEKARSLEDNYLRAAAEFDNVKKRLEKERQDSVKFANETLIKDLLPVLDDLERALEHAEINDAGPDGLIEGIKMTRQKFIEVLDRFGAKSLSAVGEKFDPNFHEAVMQQEDPDVEENTVIKQIQSGYMLKDRLIRPAMVVVSKKG